MQTEYRLLYRYMNPTTNTAVTDEADYEKTEIFYNKDHALNIDKTYLDSLQTAGYNLKFALDGDTSENYVDVIHQLAEADRESLITENMANENKSNNLYVYTGTKKYFHKKYIPEQVGYKVRDWKKVPSSQIPKDSTDYTKHFVMLGGDHLGVDGAYLVCKPQYIDLYMKYRKDGKSNGDKCFLEISTTDGNNYGSKNNSKYYNKNSYIEDLYSFIDEEIFFEWYNPTDNSITPEFNEVPIEPTGGEVDCEGTKVIWTHSHVGKIITVNSSQKLTYVDTDQYVIFFNNTKGTHTLPTIPQSTFSVPVSGSISYTNTWKGWSVADLAEAGYTNYATKITINSNNIIKAIIPEHYEDTGNLPYYIKDTYEKIPFSPWILHSVHHSLESGLESAKKLVSMIGINNVKLIKHVPIEQFVKIK